MELPGRDLAVGANSAFDIDHAGRPEVGPGEFFFAGPDDLDRRAGASGEPCRFNRDLAGVFAAIARAGIRHDYSDLVWRQMERLNQFTLDSKGPLSPCPDSQLAVLPLSKGGSGFERGVGNVGNGVSALQLVIGCSQRLLD